MWWFLAGLIIGATIGGGFIFLWITYQLQPD